MCGQCWRDAAVGMLANTMGRLYQLGVLRAVGYAERLSNSRWFALMLSGILGYLFAIPLPL